MLSITKVRRLGECAARLYGYGLTRYPRLTRAMHARASASIRTQVDALYSRSARQSSRRTFVPCWWRHSR